MYSRGRTGDEWISSPIRISSFRMIGIPAATARKNVYTRGTSTARTRATLNSEVTQAFVPPTSASPDWMTSPPLDMPRAIRTTITIQIQKSGRRA